MKGLIIVLIAAGCFMGFTQQPATKNSYINQPEDTLHWRKDRKLSWDDFQGEPDLNSTGMAGTSSGLVTESKYTSDSTISIIVRAVFFKNVSWVKDGYKDSATLNHEQRHFDITEVYARLTTAAFKKYKYNKTTVNSDINRIFDSFINEKNKIQALYDKETTKPINNHRQKEWDKKIDKWLAEEQPY